MTLRLNLSYSIAVVQLLLVLQFWYGISMEYCDVGEYPFGCSGTVSFAFWMLALACIAQLIAGFRVEFPEKLRRWMKGLYIASAVYLVLALIDVLAVFHALSTW